MTWSYQLDHYHFYSLKVTAQRPNSPSLFGFDFYGLTFRDLGLWLGAGVKLVNWRNCNIFISHKIFGFGGELTQTQEAYNGRLQMALIQVSGRSSSEPECSAPQTQTWVQCRGKVGTAPTVTLSSQTSAVAIINMAMTFRVIYCITWDSCWLGISKALVPRLSGLCFCQGQTFEPLSSYQSANSMLQSNNHLELGST